MANVIEQLSDYDLQLAIDYLKDAASNAQYRVWQDKTAGGRGFAARELKSLEAVVAYLETCTGGRT